MASLRNLLLLTAASTVLGVSSPDFPDWDDFCLDIDSEPDRSEHKSTHCHKPTSTCDKHGYLIQSTDLIRVDLASGEYETVGTNVASDNVNALGYNPRDNFLYGYEASTAHILKIGLDGESVAVAVILDAANYILGDFDADGYYWAGTGNAAEWIKVDLRPESSTYGDVVERGTTAAPDGGRTTADWAYIPIAGEYLWAVGANPAGGSSLMRWCLYSHLWETLDDYPDTDNTFGAMYAINNGTIYASDNGNGHIWAYSVMDNTAPYVASQGPASSSNDGARCVANVEV